MFKKLWLKLFIFFVYPFGGFLFSLLDIRSRSSRYIFFLFLVLFGFTFTPTDVGLDSERYVQYFYTYAKQNTGDFLDYIQIYFTFESEKAKDLYLRTSYFIVSSFTDNYHYLFALYALVFAFFYIKTFKFIVTNKNFNNALPFYSLILLFCLSNPIFNINGVRFWTASWIAVYVMFQIFVNNEKKYFLLALLTPLVHGSFFLYLLLLLLIHFTRKFETVWIPIFVISLFASAVSFLNMSNQFKNFLPSFLQYYLYLYTESYYALEKMAGVQKHIIIQIIEFLPLLFIAITIFLFIKNKDIIKKDMVSKNIFEIILIWFSFAYFALNIPSVGGRFFQTGIPLIVFLWINSYPIMRRYNNWLIFGFPIAFAYHIWGYLVRMAMVSDPYLFFSTLIHLVLKNS